MQYRNHETSRPRTSRARKAVLAGLAVLVGGPAHAALEPIAGFGDAEANVEVRVDSADTVLNDAVVLDNGKLLVVGETSTASDWDMVVMRFESDGSLDTTFGESEGWTRIAFDKGGTQDDRGYGIALRSDGGIVLAGTAAVATNESDMAVARLDASGAVLDRATFDVAEDRDDVAWDVTIDSTDRIYLAGSAGDPETAPRENADGIAIRLDGQLALDPSFADDGVFRKSSDAHKEFVAYRNVEIRPDNGKVLLVGETDELNSMSDPLVTQLRTDGTGDPVFGNDNGATGDFLFSVAGASVWPWAMEVDPAGRVVIAGASAGSDDSGATQGIVIARITGDGAGFDAAFGASGTDGVTALDPGPDVDRIFDLVIDSRGRIVFVGSSRTVLESGGTGSASLIGRLGADGAVDETFGESGTGLLEIANRWEELYGLVLPDDDTFLAVGAYMSDSSNAVEFDTGMYLARQVEGVDSDYPDNGTSNDGNDAGDDGSTDADDESEGTDTDGDSSSGGGGGGTGIGFLGLLLLATGRRIARSPKA